MFSFFKKKPMTIAKIDARTHQLLAGAAEILILDLSFCKAEEEIYNKFLHSKFVRGYFIGFFDSVLQNSRIGVIDDNHFISLMVAGHSYLLDGGLEKASAYTIDSLALQGNQEFDRAQVQGGETYFNFMNGSDRMPNGLSRKFHDNKTANN
jgi:hypothetical protein